MSKRIYILLLLSFALGACISSSRKQNKTSSYQASLGTMRNKVRMADSLPIIPKSWIIVIQNEDEITWAASKDFWQGKGHIAKTVGFDNAGEVLFEEDLYYSGNKKPCKAMEKESYYEFLNVRYTYQKNPITSQHWSAEGICCELYTDILKKHPKFSDELLRVNSVLSQWGISRLN